MREIDPDKMRLAVQLLQTASSLIKEGGRTGMSMRVSGIISEINLLLRENKVQSIYGEK